MTEPTSQSEPILLAYRNGKMSRREAISSLIATGMSATAAISILGTTPASAQDALSIPEENLPAYGLDDITPSAQIKQMRVLGKLIEDREAREKFLEDPAQFTVDNGTLFTPGMLQAAESALVYGEKPNPVAIPEPVEQDPILPVSPTQWMTISPELDRL